MVEYVVAKSLPPDCQAYELTYKELANGTDESKLLQHVSDDAI